MGKPVSPEEYKSYLGKELGTSEWFSITQDRINTFAECTEDRQWIHVNEEMAKKGPYGTTIAHGYLVLSLLPYFSYQNEVFPGGIKFALNYGLNRLRFISPFPAGCRVRNRAVLKEVSEKGEGRLLLVTENTVEIEGQDKPGMVAESLAMVFI